jgi:hypothetical protein
LVHELEVLLHAYLRERLEEKYGPGEEGWWSQGVPLNIRQECAGRREGDPGRDHPFTYAFLIDVVTILEKNWALVEPDAQRAGKLKGEVLSALKRANEVRNRYSHPIRAPSRGSEDFTRDAETAGAALTILQAMSGDGGD